ASSGGCTTQRSYTVVVDCPTITLNPSTLSNGQMGVNYSQQLSVTPSGPYSFVLQTGTLPAGLMLNSSTGLLSGTPTVPGSYNFTIKAQTASGCLTTRAYTQVITCPTITLSPASLPNGAVGTSYSQTLSATLAGGNYSYAISSGALPTGLN